jgi:hypothetical protein
MVGNVALDVVIGLVFVYLLYSLYATVLMEMISSFLGLRGRNLAYALRRMLTDEKEYEGKKWKSRVARWFTSIIQMSGYAINLTNDYVFKKFFEQHSVKSLSSGGANNTPSYMKPESFTKGLLDAVKSKDPNLNNMANILKGIESLPRSAAKEHLQSLMNDANNDPMKFKILLEDWFNTTMDRASGWYKRSVQVILFIIGLWLAFIFNLDTAAIIKTLSKDPHAREQLAKMAVEFSQNDANLAQNKPGTQLKDSLLTSGKFNKRMDSLESIRGILNQDISATQDILGGWHISKELQYYNKTWFDKLKVKPQLNKDFVYVPYTITSTPILIVVHKSVSLPVLKCVLPVALDKDKKLTISPLMYKMGYVFDHFWGYFLTALALSLGSPFWFDLLNKLVKLKTSVTSATTSSPASGTPNSAQIAAAEKKDILNRVG